MIRLFFRKFRGNTSGVEKITVKSIGLYPNPTTGNLQLDIENPIDYALEILDATGNLVKQEQLSTNQISLSELANGMYFIRLQHLSSQTFYQNKVVKSW